MKKLELIASAIPDLRTISDLFSILASLPSLFSIVTGVIAAVFIRRIGPTRRASIAASDDEINEEAQRKKVNNMHIENEDALERVVSRQRLELQDQSRQIVEYRDHVKTLQIRVAQIEQALRDKNIGIPLAIFIEPMEPSNES